MAVLEINGHKVQVDDSFLSLSPEQQQKTVEQIAGSLGPTDARSAPHPDPNYVPPQPPAGMVLNPQTGQLEDLRSPANPHIPTGTGNAAAVGAGEGLGFGSLDEAVGGLNAAIGHGGTAGQRYDYGAGVMREAERRAEQDHPGAYYAGFVPGAAASSMAAWGAAGVNPTGANLMGTMARGAGMGATEGAVYGGMSGEGAANRAANAAKMAGLGGVIGASAPSAIALGAKALGYGRDLATGGVDTMLGRANQSKANRAIMDTLRRGNVTPDQVHQAVKIAALEGQPEFRLMDAAGMAGQRRASGIVRAGGDGAEKVAKFLEQRQLDQPNRVASFVEDAFGTGGKTAKQTQTGLEAARKAAADTAYDAARKQAGPVDVRGPLGVINDRIGQMQGSGVQGDSIDGLLSRFRDRLSAKNPATSTVGSTAPAAGDSGGYTAVHLSDFDRVLGVKQDVQDAIGRAVRAGENNKARELGKLLDSLDGALEDASPAYRQANDDFAKASRVIDSVQAGSDMARPGARYQDTVGAFSGMTPEQQQAARAGYADKLLGKIESNASPTSNSAKIFGSTKVRNEANAMATDPNLLARRAGRENDMWGTQNRALGGSRTADNQMDVKDLTPLKNVALALRDASHGNFGSAVGNIGAAVGPALSGKNKATRDLIAQMLMSSDPKATLSQAVRQEMVTQNQRRIAEAMTRALGRKAVAGHLN